MTVKSLAGSYTGNVRDSLENFHGQQLIYVGWDHHMMFCSPFTFLVPPTLPFIELLEQVLPAVYADHPEWSDIRWDRVNWLLDGNAFTPEMATPLLQQGIGHKSLLRFQTSDLPGFMNAGV